MIIVKFLKLNKNAKIPKYQTEHSAAMDVCAALNKPIVLKPGERAIIKTGFAMAIPVGYEIQIRARSGLAAKNGIGLVNGIGTIDADYRGELGVILINYGKEDFKINNGDRIAQMVVAKCEKATWQVVDSLDSTERGDGGFGSTGK